MMKDVVCIVALLHVSVSFSRWSKMFGEKIWTF